MAGKTKRPRTQWYRMDLHIHTPGSRDYQEPNVSLIDILRRAELRHLDIIALTDYNSLRGYAAMMREIEQLTFLERLNRAEPEEQRRLAEYRRLLEKILVLPGFKFTATFGFRILGIFSPDMPIRQIEHILMTLGIPPDVMDEGVPYSRATADVLTAYRTINEAGGIVIAAHANEEYGVAMRGFDFGGQTKIAFTQDPFLHALEVTDLDDTSKRATARFFDGSKPEYPRRMRCIQGSNAHALSSSSKKQLGIGDRVTEVLLPERSFDALLEMFQGTDFARTRPYRSSRDPYDYIQAAREEGPSIVQSFHEQFDKQQGLFDVLADIAAMANTNGGVIYMGVSDNPKQSPVGIKNPSATIDLLYAEIDSRVTPKLDVEIDAQECQGKSVVRIQVSRGQDVPYAIDDNKIYMRDDTETSLAVRDEIVQMVLRLHKRKDLSVAEPDKPVKTSSTSDGDTETISSEKLMVEPPRTGVEIIASEERKGRFYHTVRDLRNSNTVHNVTRSSARRLWHYAITEHESRTLKLKDVRWRGQVGLIKSYQRGKDIRYDLAQYDDNGDAIRVFYGVTDEGLHGPWQAFARQENDNGN